MPSFRPFSRQKTQEFKLLFSVCKRNMFIAWIQSKIHNHAVSKAHIFTSRRSNPENQNGTEPFGNSCVIFVIFSFTWNLPNENKIFCLYCSKIADNTDEFAKLLQLRRTQLTNRLNANSFRSFHGIFLLSRLNLLSTVFSIIKPRWIRAGGEQSRTEESHLHQSVFSPLHIDIWIIYLFHFYLPMCLSPGVTTENHGNRKK